MKVLETQEVGLERFLSQTGDDAKEIGKCENQPKIGGFEGLSFPVGQGVGALARNMLVPNPQISVTAVR